MRPPFVRLGGGGGGGCLLEEFSIPFENQPEYYQELCTPILLPGMVFPLKVNRIALLLSNQG